MAANPTTTQATLDGATVETTRKRASTGPQSATKVIEQVLTTADVERHGTARVCRWATRAKAEVADR
jgi:hypothetical protein